MTHTITRKNPNNSYRIDHRLETRPGVSWRDELGIGDAATVTVPAHVLAAQIRRGELQHANVTSAIMGDPLPGYSMLDRSTISPVTVENSPKIEARIDSRSGMPRGVQFNERSGKYQARIGLSGRRISLGYFETAEQAHAAYRQATIGIDD